MSQFCEVTPVSEIQDSHVDRGALYYPCRDSYDWDWDFDDPNTYYVTNLVYHC